MASKMVYVVIDEPNELECIISAHRTKREAIVARDAYNAEHGTQAYIGVNTTEEMKKVPWKGYS